MTSAAEQVAGLAAWQAHEARLHRVVPYAGLVLGSVLSIFAAAPGSLPLTVSLPVALVAAGWVGWFVDLHPGWRQRRRLMAGYYLGLLAFAAVLIVASPWYGFFAWAGFLHAGLALRGRWRLAGVGACAVLVATAQSAGPPDSLAHWLLWAVLVLFNVGVAGGVTWFSTLNDRQHALRKKLVEELAEANHRLAETMRENEGLHAQLLTQAREAGVLDERQRMAREIHDTLAQGLTGIITQLAAAGQARDRPADWQRHVDTAVALARESLTEARRSVRAVRPEPLETARLPEVLTDLVRRWSTINEVPGEVHTTGTPRPLHPEVEVTLLRAAQEALANAARHADPTRVRLTLSYMADEVTLDVRDDGKGFDDDGDRTTADGGFGLAAMRQRVTGVGGRLAVESEPGVGTAVSASVPALPGAVG
ncbi:MULTISPECIES: sensor histidine kinase [Micromonospora]|uniref:Oxygen sensor histidine kinase NreB n=1 Tax=Micromonospora yangpuensis TaxID=683228 RepID=A0A1C6VC89_9ACTN|nr:sensor histidine kinase [Micromonospora yangpuensis]GGM13046.1 histidine kinase [Micromonospora yangpuensis]SCL64011.1 Signal transduction histidine kinase [Micromonospora yangpuensis]